MDSHWFWWLYIACAALILPFALLARIAFSSTVRLSWLGPNSTTPTRQPILGTIFAVLSGAAFLFVAISTFAYWDYLVQGYHLVKKNDELYKRETAVAQKESTIDQKQQAVDKDLYGDGGTEADPKPGSKLGKLRAVEELWLGKGGTEAAPKDGSKLFALKKIEKEWVGESGTEAAPKDGSTLKKLRDEQGAFTKERNELRQKVIDLEKERDGLTEELNAVRNPPDEVALKAKTEAAKKSLTRLRKAFDAVPNLRARQDASTGRTILLWPVTDNLWLFPEVQMTVADRMKEKGITPDAVTAVAFIASNGTRIDAAYVYYKKSLSDEAESGHCFTGLDVYDLVTMKDVAETAAGFLETKSAAEMLRPRTPGYKPDPRNGKFRDFPAGP